MIHGIKHICPVEFQEKFSAVTYETEINYHLTSDSYAVEGTVSAETNAIIHCSCGQKHTMLVSHKYVVVD